MSLTPVRGLGASRVAVLKLAINRWLGNVAIPDTTEDHDRGLPAARAILHQ
jgi:hypothetical protein